MFEHRFFLRAPAPYSKLSDQGETLFAMNETMKPVTKDPAIKFGPV
jgi:hypothetical protein